MRSILRIITAVYCVTFTIKDGKEKQKPLIFYRDTWKKNGKEKIKKIQQ